MQPRRDGRGVDRERHRCRELQGSGQAYRVGVVALIDGLEGKDLVERRRSAEDRRNYELHLTAEGRRTLGAVSRAAAAHEDALLAALDPEQRTHLLGLLERVAAEQELTPGVHPGYRTRG
ncbi:hypothetical protein ABZ128_05165 [Streptomyces sp. NPDC006326]|uniref:MarR family winged helix-turn-helix transcriptional regulator n=1 Tax=Streptomyces sp. NPDC006326 TaxID=3156752 RepID=UPI0033ADD18B